MRRKFLNRCGIPAMFGLVFFLGCARDSGTSVSMMVIQPTGANCGYKVDYAPITTLTNVNTVQGALGRVVFNKKNIATTDVLINGAGFRPIDAHFSSSGNTYGPLDMPTLFAASLYYGIEKSALLFKSLDASGDMLQLVPNLADTLIVYNAKVQSEYGSDIRDNATFMAFPLSGGLYQHYFLAHPTEEVKNIPLGLNVGVVGHEFTHLVFHQLFASQRDDESDSVETKNTLNALNEGLADYFGYMITRDPGFIGCSLPSEDFRNLSVPKVVDTAHAADIRSDSEYNFYEAGAVWASVQYEIGQLIGFEANGQSLIKLMSNLLTCPETNLNSTGTGLNFSKIAACHQRLLGSRADSRIQQIYSRAFSATGSSR